MSENKPADLQVWFIGIGLLVASLFTWFALGQPGTSLQDGDYGCSAGPEVIGGGPGATVKNGEVIDVWDFDMSTGEKISLRWSNPTREHSKEFSVTSEVPMAPSNSARYVCSNPE